MVTCLRSPWSPSVPARPVVCRGVWLGGATTGVLDGSFAPVEAVSACPHASQNRLPGGLLWPHEAQVAARAAPQPLQNLAPGRFSAPQAMHPIAPSIGVPV